MAQDDSMALNCRVRIDKKVHPSLYQELESLGRRDRCERLRSLAQQGLLAEALGVDTVAAAVSTPRQKKSRRRSAPTAAQQDSPSQQARQDLQPDSGLPAGQPSQESEGQGATSSVPEPTVESAQGASRNDEMLRGDGPMERAEPLRSSSQRLMGVAGMLTPEDGVERPEEK